MQQAHPDAGRGRRGGRREIDPPCSNVTPPWHDAVSLDTRIDLEENQIEEECLKILALHQPVAVDLRRVATIVKINSDLEP